MNILKQIEKICEAIDNMDYNRIVITDILPKNWEQFKKFIVSLLFIFLSLVAFTMVVAIFI